MSGTRITLNERRAIDWFKEKLVSIIQSKLGRKADKDKDDGPSKRKRKKKEINVENVEKCRERTTKLTELEVLLDHYGKDIAYELVTNDYEVYL